MLDVPSGLTMSDPREAFVLKSGQWRPSNRLILNSRRMGFDVPLPSSPSPAASLRYATSFCVIDGPYHIVTQRALS